MGCLICIFILVGAWLIGAFLAEAGRIAAPVLLGISVVGWFFLMIAIGGRKGFPVGLWLVVFVVCIFFFWLGFSGLFKTIPGSKTGNWAYLVLIPASFLVLAIPVWVAKIGRKIVKKEKSAGGKEKKEKTITRIP